MELRAGQIWWADPDPEFKPEQTGRRPLLIVANDGYHLLMSGFTLAVPLTATKRGWPNHIPVDSRGLEQQTFAMTEQVRVISRERLTTLIDSVSPETLKSIRMWIGEFLTD